MTGGDIEETSFRLVEKNTCFDFSLPRTLLTYASTRINSNWLLERTLDDIDVNKLPRNVVKDNSVHSLFFSF